MVAIQKRVTCRTVATKQNSMDGAEGTRDRGRMENKRKRKKRTSTALSIIAEMLVPHKKKKRLS